MKHKHTIFEVFLDDSCYIVDAIDRSGFSCTHIDTYLPSLKPYSEQITELLGNDTEDIEPITVKLTHKDLRELAYYYRSPVIGIVDAEFLYNCFLLLYDQVRTLGVLTMVIRNKFDDEEV